MITNLVNIYNKNIINEGKITAEKIRLKAENGHSDILQEVKEVMLNKFIQIQYMEKDLFIIHSIKRIFTHKDHIHMQKMIFLMLDDIKHLNIL